MLASARACVLHLALSQNAVPMPASVAATRVMMEVGFIKKNGQRLSAARKFTQAWGGNQLVAVPSRPDGVSHLLVRKDLCRCIVGRWCALAKSRGIRTCRRNGRRCQRRPPFA